MASSITAEAAGAIDPYPLPNSLSLQELRALLTFVNPYCSEAERNLVVKSVHRATHGSEAGFAVLKKWHEKSPDYPGHDAATQEWALIKYPDDADIGEAWLCQLLVEYEIDWLEILGQTVPDFEAVDFEVVTEQEVTTPTAEKPTNALTRYSLRDHRAEIEEVASNRSLILDGLFLQGQLATTYGPPAVGKSAILTELIRRDLQLGVLVSEKVLYIDLDNNPAGLLDRLRILDQVGCHVLAEGFRGFSSRKVVPALEQFIQEGHAKNSLVVVDTTKKVVDLMEKAASTEFAKRLRKLTNAGGTFIGLAHTNKHRGPDGRLIHAGTTDLLEDFDCAHLLYEISNDPKNKTKTVIFENMKSRGSVAKSKAYQYSTAEGQTYDQLLRSICEVDLEQLGTVEHAQQQRDDRTLINAISESIRAGTVLKMSIVERVTNATRSSKREVLDVLDRYCGTDTAKHKWDFDVVERGGKRYRLLDDINKTEDDEY